MFASLHKTHHNYMLGYREDMSMDMRNLIILSKYLTNKYIKIIYTI